MSGIDWTVSANGIVLPRERGVKRTGEGNTAPFRQAIRSLGFRHPSLVGAGLVPALWRLDTRRLGIHGLGTHGLGTHKGCPYDGDNAAGYDRVAPVAAARCCSRTSQMDSLREEYNTGEETFSPFSCYDRTASRAATDSPDPIPIVPDC